MELCKLRDVTLIKPQVMTILLGLLVKELLCQSNLRSDCSDIAHNTSGVIFYSTPHRGSALANISNRGSRIFFPTVEVQELSQGRSKPRGTLCTGIILKTYHKCL